MIPKQVLVNVQSAGTAEIIDPFLIHMKQPPKKADFVSDTSKLLRARWTIDRMEFSGGSRLDLKISLVHRKARNKAFVTIQVVGADNTDQGTGSCGLQS
ncbi:hypothetical protein [Epibacterium ulvae]|uniref:hypothetical protein n=1 Tax=Epibacterium ulvae TaxID=1156985 RepID=UPI001BFC843A|nr:hypothetical protein [Epibacterium ulvae]